MPSRTKSDGQTKLDVRATTAPSQPQAAPASIAEGSLNRVLELCARRLGLEHVGKVIERLKVGDREVQSQFRLELAREAAVRLSSLDRNIKAVYMAEYDAMPEDLAFAEQDWNTPVNLIVWVTRKTAALNAAAAALDRALIESYEEQIGPDHPAYLVDVQIVDDHDVTNRKGYGAMLTSIHMPPLEIWRDR